MKNAQRLFKNSYFETNWIYLNAHFGCLPTQVTHLDTNGLWSTESLKLYRKLMNHWKIHQTKWDKIFKCHIWFFFRAFFNFNWAHLHVFLSVLKIINIRTLIVLIISSSDSSIELFNEWSFNCIYAILKWVFVDIFWPYNCFLVVVMVFVKSYNFYNIL